MCGIAGIWNRSGRPADPAALERMAAILHHRGPDGSGIHLDGELGLANTRLKAIVDPTPAGEQPMGLQEAACIGLPPFLFGRAESRAFRRSVDISPLERERPYASSVNIMCGTSCATGACPRCSMPRTRSAWRSLSSRVTPFLDHRLVELCFSW